MKKCPYCAEDIQDDAIKCKHCGEWLENKEVSSTDKTAYLKVESINELSEKQQHPQDLPESIPKTFEKYEKKQETTEKINAVEAKKTQTKSTAHSQSDKDSLPLKKTSRTGAKRFLLCFGAAILLIIYSDAATTLRLPFYLPIGLLIMSVYVWFVLRFKKIYPASSKAIGQLCITFFLVSFTAFRQMKQLLPSIEQTPENISENTIFAVAHLHALSTVGAVMVTGLMIIYLILKAKNRKGAIITKDNPVKCPSCGKLNERSAIFCSYCGKEQKKIPWGWGWIILLCVYGYGRFLNPLPKTSSNTLAGILVISEFASIILLFLIYFWLRKRWLKKGRFGDKAPFLAGLASFFIIFTLVVFITSFSTAYIGKIEETADTKKFLTAYIKRGQELNQEEYKIMEPFIVSPESDSDIEHNLKIIDEYLVFIDKKVALSKEFIKFSKDLSKRGRYRIISQDVNNLELILDKYYDTNRKVYETLKRYYQSGNENIFNDYEKLLLEYQGLEKEYKLTLNKILKGIP